MEPGTACSSSRHWCVYTILASRLWQSARVTQPWPFQNSMVSQWVTELKPLQKLSEWVLHSEAVGVKWVFARVTVGRSVRNVQCLPKEATCSRQRQPKPAVKLILTTPHVACKQCRNMGTHKDIHTNTHENRLKDFIYFLSISHSSILKIRSHLIISYMTLIILTLKSALPETSLRIFLN